MVNPLDMNVSLTDKEFKVIADFVESHLGIKMPDGKKIMLQSRLKSRLKKLNMASFAEYINYVFHSAKGADEELVHMIDVITTNKTEFFRESDHFTYMTDTVLPEITAGSSQIKIWSAGCSTGEEPYTLAIVMEEFKRKANRSDLDYSILATDISTRVLEKARNAIYAMSSVENISLELKKRYFLRSKEAEKDLVRLRPEIRKKITFQRLNFMDEKFNVPNNFDIIFCRNVIIYFDKETQETLINKFCKHLKNNGFLFLGHSETIMGMDLP